MNNSGMIWSKINIIITFIVMLIVMLIDNLF
jgi:hypothetical protein